MNATPFRSGFVALLGRPNVGKSTLLNYLVGQKIAITSPTAQTTRQRLRGIVTLPEGQMILVDTPGIHKPHHRLGEILVKNAQTLVRSVDVVLLLVDGSQPAGTGDGFIAQGLATQKTPVLLGLNKQDLVADEQGERITASYQALLPAAPLLPFSAVTGQGIPELQAQLLQALPPGPCYYPPEMVTDQPERFIMAELIREQIFHLTREEVPHAVAVVVERVEETPKITRIFAAIVVERPSQKAIIIGNQGQMLKTIGSQARQEMQKLISGPVYLQLFVKVEPKWRQTPRLLQDLGYRLES
ncbi:GTP-binding protein Era [Gloeomargarita lithophora Alchichica-D10]|uniref:GTPase Era n=1 Tax=Gloeomargarita lithophora Alchichica-D10 TaxID=1188229 RepID=A0A1J0AAL4_9CYAN|nr:GTPase Era [Gloeomargarita lithophora]APB32967.1 GTP-binding protein Era [Gloeomargarita lithophora Alchichica-D10]